MASNPDLSILNEMRFVHAAFPDVPGSSILRMGTLAGAEALGWHETAGSLEPRKSADFVVVPLPDLETEDPHELWLESAQEVQATWFQGRERTGIARG